MGGMQHYRLYFQPGIGTLRLWLQISVDVDWEQLIQGAEYNGSQARAFTGLHA